MKDRKALMAEAAVLYYEKKYTQQEIAQIMKLARQTVSRLLAEAVEENVVEIRINEPGPRRDNMTESLKKAFGLRCAVVRGAASDDGRLRLLETVRGAASYIGSEIAAGGMNIAVAWGHTIRALIDEMPAFATEGNTVFPLFGATDCEQPFFMSNELAGAFAAKIGAKVKYAWFPYRPDGADDRKLFERTSYCRELRALWRNIDLAIVGIGDLSVLKMFEKSFGGFSLAAGAAGDIATHFFDADGKLVGPYPDTLCVSAKELAAARQVIAVACGKDKTAAITGALRTGLIDTLITDEYTAREILSAASSRRKNSV